MKPNRKYKLAVAAVGLCLSVAIWVIGQRHWTKSRPLPAIESARRDLVQKDGRWYRQGQTNPFTGFMIDHYSGGALLSRCQVSNGLLNGVSESWYTNGQMQVREHFKDGVSHGLREKWHEDGHRLSQATIVDGKVTGTFRSWHDSGQLSEQIEMKLGKPDGIAWAWYPSGFVKAETMVRDGQILNRKSWKDGERAASALQE
jgi:antitoxin component YwqK of YwqJK toxin-antitoxin module